jgi:hypothetical protein
MRAHILFPTLLALAAACASPERQEAPNTLSESRRRAGWELLFDGRTTDGWRGYRQTSCPAGWQVIDGALTRVAEAGDLVTVDEYQDFVLEFEWRIAPGGNSGVMFHVTEDHDAPWETGPEYQILDDAGHKDGLDPLTSAGSNYAMHAPARDVTHPAGEWNQSRLSVVGTHVEHWLNGVEIVEYDLGSDDWKARVAACKWKDRADYGKRSRGRIALQDHGDRVAYRSLRLLRTRPATVSGGR